MKTSLFNGHAPFNEFEANKTWQEKAKHFMANLMLLPILGVVYLMVSAAGLRSLIPYLGTKLHRFPLAAQLKHYEGWSDVDIAMVMVCGLLIGGLYCWYGLIGMVARWNDVDRTSPFFWLTLAIYLIIVGADSALIYFGFVTRNASLWSGGDTSMYLALLATLLYTTTMAAVSRWHYLFHHKETEL